MSLDILKRPQYKILFVFISNTGTIYSELLGDRNLMGWLKVKVNVVMNF